MGSEVWGFVVGWVRERGGEGKAIMQTAAARLRRTPTYAPNDLRRMRVGKTIQADDGSEHDKQDCSTLLLPLALSHGIWV